MVYSAPFSMANARMSSRLYSSKRPYPSLTVSASSARQSWQKEQVSGSRVIAIYFQNTPSHREMPSAEVSETMAAAISITIWCLYSAFSQFSARFSTWIPPASPASGRTQQSVLILRGSAMHGQSDIGNHRPCVDWS